ncbi:MAG: patatin-like phospholipase family protein [Chitinophagales bacterium]|nr:patatin-like phospholipase family protein [Chitinophagales bacterium]
MFSTIKKYWYSFVHFFPVQLLALSLRKHIILLLPWVVFFSIAIGKFGASFGVPYLYLAPEYIGEVGYVSFAIVGMGFGVFYVTWNLVGYIVNSHRFQFLASLENPLSVFFINNSAIPILFIVGYLLNTIKFQKYFEFQSWQHVGIDILGFIAGFTFILIIISIYFQYTNKSAAGIAYSYKRELRRKKLLRKLEQNEELDINSKWRVDAFISRSLRFRYTRSVEHYEDDLNNLVFRQHHINAFIVQAATIAFLIAIGFWVENPFVQIPTAASTFLLASVIVSILGMFIYWAGGWGTFMMIVAVITINELTKYEIFGYQSRAYGLNYTVKPASYTLDSLRSLASIENIKSDIKGFIPILNNWKEKNTKQGSEKKPKLVFITASGGGLRSAAFTMAFLQKADSILDGTLMQKTFMMDGASGGSLALTFYRELYSRKMNGEAIDLTNKKYLEQLSLDLLNPMGINILSNDLFLPVHKFKLNGQTYFRDRGYMFERYFAKNTGMRFSKTLADYRKDELSAKVPVLLFHASSTSDSRMFYMSAHPVRFLMRPYNKRSAGLDLSIDAVDFGSLFKEQNGANLDVLSAMRMGATFPYILPATILPCEPPTYLVDGGALDNFGVMSVTKFLITFRDWINQNTDGVVIIQTRDAQKDEEPGEVKQKTFIQQTFQPLEALYANLENIQDFNTDRDLALINESLKGKLQFILFEYIPEKKTEKASMSLRLIAREKKEILKALELGNNSRSFEVLKRALAN